MQKKLRAEFRLGLGNRFPQKAPRFVSVYKAAGGHASDALDELVCRQVLRKLERIRDPRQKTRVQVIHEHLERWPFKGKKPTQSLALSNATLDRLS